MVEIPEAVARLFQETPLADFALASQVRIAAAVMLYQQDAVAIGDAARMARVARIPSEELLCTPPRTDGGLQPGRFGT